MRPERGRRTPKVKEALDESSSGLRKRCEGGDKRKGDPESRPVAPVAGLTIVRGDNPDLFARLQVVIGAEGLLGVALGEDAKVDKRGVGDVR